MRLNQKLDDLDRLNANARQALKMAADAQGRGDATKAAEYNSTAETIATQLIQVEKDVESQKTFLLEAARASDQAKAAVEQNSRLLQQKISEQSKLLSQLDQAKMQEEMNSAMASLNETVGGDVPTFNEVEQKIQARYAKAKAMSELNDTSVESRMLEVEQATANVEAQSRLDAMRQELGITPPVVATTTPPAELSAQSATPSEPVPEPAPEAQPAPADRRVLHPLLISTSRIVRQTHDFATPEFDRAQAVGRTTRSSRWITSWAMPSGRSRVCSPATRRRRAASTDTIPRANTRPSTSRTSTVSASTNEPSTSTTPAGSRLVERSTSARRAPASTVTVPATRAANAIHSLRAPRRRLRAPRSACPPARRARHPSSTSGRAALAITVGTPDHEAMRAASSLLAMPPLPRPLPPTPAVMASSGSFASTPCHQLGAGIEPRVGGVQAVEVGEQHEQPGAPGCAPPATPSRSLSP